MKCTSSFAGGRGKWFGKTIFIIRSFGWKETEDFIGRGWGRSCGKHWQWIQILASLFASVSSEFSIVLIFFFLLLLQIGELLSSYLELVVSLVLFGCLFLV